MLLHYCQVHLSLCANFSAHFELKGYLVVLPEILVPPEDHAEGESDIKVDCMDGISIYCRPGPWREHHAQVCTCQHLENIGRGWLRNATSQEAAGSLDQRNGAPARSPCEGGIAKKSQVVFLYTYSELVLGVLSLTTSRPSTGRKRLNGMINLGCTKRPCSKR